MGVQGMPILMCSSHCVLMGFPLEVCSVLSSFLSWVLASDLTHLMVEAGRGSGASACHLYFQDATLLSRKTPAISKDPSKEG